MDLQFTIRPREAVLTPGEALVLDAEAINRGPGPVSVPAFNSPGNRLPEYRITGSNGEAALDFGPTGEADGARNLERDTQIVCVEPGRRYAEAVVLHTPLARAGRYEVVAKTAVYASGTSGTVEARADFAVDEIHFVQAAMSRRRGQTELSQAAAARLFHGARIHAVERRSFTDSGKSDGVIDVSAIVRSVDVAPVASGLVSFYSAEPEPHPELDWVAWLEPGSVCANARCLGGRVLRWPLPPGRHAIVPPGLLSAEGDFEVIIAGLEKPTLRLVRFGQPKAVVFPEVDSVSGPEPDAEADEPEQEAEPEEDEQEDEEFELYTAAEPTECWAVEISLAAPAAGPEDGSGNGQQPAEPALAAAIAPARAGGGRRMVFMVQRPAGVEVLHLAFNETGPPENMGIALLPHALLLASSRPGIVVDDANNTRVALPVWIAPGGQGEAYLAVADLSFDANGGVRMEPGVGLRGLGAPAGVPRAGAADFWIALDRGIRRDWTVLYGDGTVAIGLGDGPVRRLNARWMPALPLEIVSLEFSCAIAVTEENGQSRMISA
jgi:hypothetical protein